MPSCKIFRAALLTSAFLGACNQEASDPFPQGPWSARQDPSVFATYAGQYCTLDQGEGKPTLRTSCENLRDFLDPKSPSCQKLGKGGTVTAVFPGHDRTLAACLDTADPERVAKDVVRFVVFGDAGVGQDARDGKEQVRVAKAMAKICVEAGCDFALVVGDLIYPSGIGSVFDSVLQSRFEEVYAAFGRFDFYLVPGNHDHQGNVTAAVEYSWFSPRWRMPARDFAVPDLPPWLTIHGLDTTAMIAEDGVQDRTDEILAKASASLCAQPDWRLVFGHHPPFSHGQHGGEPRLAAQLETLHKACPFQVYFAGHDHHQEHIALGLFDVMIQGAGGAPVRPVTLAVAPEAAVFGDKSVTLNQRHAKKAPGFALVEARRTSLDVRFYDALRWEFQGPELTSAARPEEFSYRCRLDRERLDQGCVRVE